MRHSRRYSQSYFLCCRELSSQEARLRREVAEQETEAAAAQVSAAAEQQQEVTALTQELEAAKAQLEQLTMQLTELQAAATSTPQHPQSIIEAEEGAVVEGSEDGTATASSFSRDEATGTTCVIELRAGFASVVQAGTQADFEAGFVDALAHVTLEQLVLRLGGQYEHTTAQAGAEHARQENRSSHGATEPGAALQAWLEQCHAQSYYDRLVAQVSKFTIFDSARYFSSSTVALLHVPGRLRQLCASSSSSSSSS